MPKTRWWNRPELNRLPFAVLATVLPKAPPAQVRAILESPVSHVLPVALPRLG